MNKRRNRENDDDGDNRNITTAFAKKYKATVSMLYDRCDASDRNMEIGEYLSVAGFAQESMKLRECGTRMVGNDPNDLQQERYCRQPNWCVHCASILARKRSEQVSKASELFSAGCRRSECTVHNLIVQPRTAGAFESSIEDLQVSMQLLRDFQVTLRRYHDDHNLAHFKQIKLGSKKEQAARKTVWGPTISSIHIVPKSAIQIKDVSDIAHMHIAIVTPREGSKTFVTQTIRELWQKTRQNSLFLYPEAKDEVIRKTTRNRKKKRPRAWRKDQKEDSDEREGRLGNFWPRNTRDHTTVKAAKTFSYLGRSFKAHWSPQAMVDACFRLEDLNITPSQLYQRLGMQGVIQGAIPCEFPTGKLKHRFVALYDGSKWLVYQRKMTQD